MSLGLIFHFNLWKYCENVAAICQSQNNFCYRESHWYATMLCRTTLSPRVLPPQACLCKLYYHPRDICWKYLCCGTWKRLCLVSNACHTKQLGIPMGLGSAGRAWILRLTHLCLNSVANRSLLVDTHTGWPISFNLNVLYRDWCKLINL